MSEVLFFLVKVLHHRIADLDAVTFRTLRRCYSRHIQANKQEILKIIGKFEKASTVHDCNLIILFLLVLWIIRIFRMYDFLINWAYFMAYYSEFCILLCTSIHNTI